MYKNVCCTCKVVVLLINILLFLTFSLPSSSSLLKLPIHPAAVKRQMLAILPWEDIHPQALTFQMTCPVLFQQCNNWKRKYALTWNRVGEWKGKAKKREGFTVAAFLLSKVSIALFLVQIIALGVLARAEGKISSAGQERDITSLTLLFWLVFRFLPVCQAFTWIHSCRKHFAKKPVILNISAGA